MDEIVLVAPELVENVVCADVLASEVKEMLELGKKMIEYCYHHGGVGLACPQIGVYKKMFVYRKTENSFQIIINPTYYPLSKKPIRVLESCMSLPDKSYLVSRFKDIQAVGYVWEQEKLVKRGYAFSGNKAIYFQHECAHVGRYGTDDVGMTIRQYGAPVVGQTEDNGEVAIKPLVEMTDDGIVKEINKNGED